MGWWAGERRAGEMKEGFLEARGVAQAQGTQRLRADQEALGTRGGRTGQRLESGPRYQGGPRSCAT